MSGETGGFRLRGRRPGHLSGIQLLFHYLSYSLHFSLLTSTYLFLIYYNSLLHYGNFFWSLAFLSFCLPPPPLSLFTLVTFSFLAYFPTPFSFRLFNSLSLPLSLSLSLPLSLSLSLSPSLSLSLSLPLSLSLSLRPSARSWTQRTILSSTKERVHLPSVSLLRESNKPFR